MFKCLPLDIEGVEVVVDNILVWRMNGAEHDSMSLTMEPEIEQGQMQQEIAYLGHVL